MFDGAHDEYQDDDEDEDEDEELYIIEAIHLQCPLLPPVSIQSPKLVTKLLFHSFGISSPGYLLILLGMVAVSNTIHDEPSKSFAPYRKYHAISIRPDSAALTLSIKEDDAFFNVIELAPTSFLSKGHLLTLEHI